MHCKHLLIIGFILFANNILLAQQKSITGYVTDQNKHPIEVFNIILLNSLDSTTILGATFINGEFNINYNGLNNCIAKISSLGYSDKYFLINIIGSTVISLDTIQLVEKVVSLNEVNVIAKHPVYSQKQGKLVLNVQSTGLSNAGASIDVLKSAPWVQVDKDNNISIFGKGSPLIFIDDKEVQSLQELEMLQSSDIVNILIDRNPSARYSASAKSVIRIKTKKSNSEQLSMEINNRSIIGRKYSNATGVRINNKIGLFSNFVSYEFSKNQAKDFSKDYETNYLPDYVIQNQSSSEDNKDILRHNLFLGSNLSFNSKNELWLQYNYINRNTNRYKYTDQVIYQFGKTEINRYIEQMGDKTINQNNISAIYKATFDSLKYLLISFDYAKNINKEIVNLDETNYSKASISNSELNNNNYYSVYTFNSEYNFTFFKGFNAQAGAKFSEIDNHGGSQSSNIASGSTNYLNTNKIRDQIEAIYFIVDKSWSKFSANVGLRGEYTSTKVHGNEQTILDSSYINVFPSLLIDYKLNDKTNIAFSYAKKIDRPTFNELNPSRNYFDSLSYGEGNPLLKPTISHNLSLDFGLSKSISFSFGYTYNANPRIQSAVNDEVNPDIVKYTSLNIDKAQAIDLSMNYNYSGKRYSAYTNGGIEFPFVDIPYLEAIRKIRTPFWYFKINNDLSLGNHFSIFCNLTYRAKSVDLMTEIDPCYNLSSGIRANFLKRKLIISIEANDIFNTYDMVWNDKYGNIMSGQKPDYDNRNIRISIKYNLKNFKNVFQKQTGNEDELNRL